MAKPNSHWVCLIQYFLPTVIYFLPTLCQTRWVLRKTNQCLPPWNFGWLVWFTHFQCCSIYISVFTIISLINLISFKPSFYGALPDCTGLDSAWLVKYPVCRASDESWFCLCSNQWCISARKLKKKHLKFE